VIVRAHEAPGIGTFAHVGTARARRIARRTRAAGVQPAATSATGAADVVGLRWNSKGDVRAEADGAIGLA
jgi:hypothetical protein